MNYFKQDFDVVAWSIFAPVIEPEYKDGGERFLTADPLHLLQTGQFKHVPLIAGVTADEVSFRALCK